MEPYCREIFSSVLQNNAILDILEICDFTKSEDLMMIDYQVISRIEKYIGQCLAITIPDNIRMIMSDYHLKYPDKFKFQPIFVIRLIRAANILRQRVDLIDPSDDVNQENHIKYEDIKSENVNCKRFNNSFLDDCCSSNASLPPAAKVSRTITPSNSNCDLSQPTQGAEELSPLSSTVAMFTTPNGTPPLTMELMPKKKEINAIVGRIQHHAKVYFNISLEYKKDFDVDFEVSQDESGDAKKSGIFLCLLCHTAKGGSSRIRFNITQRNYYVLSNVSTHLTKHFEKNRRAYNIV